MQKKFEILMVACLFICSFFLARAGAAYVCAKNLNTKNLCIVLDAGHGGADPGKVGCNDILEKDVNLSIVHKLKTLFENKGFHVVLTREDDTVLADENSKNVKIEDLRNRVALITENMPIHFRATGFLLRTIERRRRNCFCTTGEFKLRAQSTKAPRMQGE